MMYDIRYLTQPTLGPVLFIHPLEPVLNDPSRTTLKLINLLSAHIFCTSIRPTSTSTVLVPVTHLSQISLYPRVSGRSLLSSGVKKVTSLHGPHHSSLTHLWTTPPPVTSPFLPLSHRGKLPSGSENRFNTTFFKSSSTRLVSTVLGQTPTNSGKTLLILVSLQKTLIKTWVILILKISSFMS